MFSERLIWINVVVVVEWQYEKQNFFSWSNWFLIDEIRSWFQIEKLRKSIKKTTIMIIRKSWSKDYWWSSMIEIQKKSMSINFLYLDIFIMNEWMSIKTNRFLPFENIRIQFSYVIYVRFIYPSSSSSTSPLSIIN